MSEGIPIKQLAERTGIQAGTIRMWEQRYGFPVPQRTSAGYRRYRQSDVEALATAESPVVISFIVRPVSTDVITSAVMS